MRVLFVTSEFYPLIKTGGLADVAAALPAALADRGVDIRIMMPGYPEAVDRAVHVGKAVPLGDLPGACELRLLPARCPISGLPIWLVDCPKLYLRTGGPYQDPDGRDWPDNDLRFAALCHAAARVAGGAARLGWHPDLVHTNDWHTGLVPLLMSGFPVPRPPVLLTIHNLAFQGLFDADRLPGLGLPAESFWPNGIALNGRLSFLKAGISHADRLTTVSRTYAQEIQTRQFGCGLHDLLKQRREDLVGIPNGADYELWDPSQDPSLPCRYNLSDLAGKRACKAFLQRELGLDAEPDTPVIAFLSRLTEQKMADTVADAVPRLVEAGAEVALHGQGDHALEDRLRALARRYTGRVSVRIGYQEPLARRLLAGADMLLHPSRFEPFGLVPIYALRYGTLPVVRGVGGLADSIADGAAGGDGQATGFAFSGGGLDDLLTCTARALEVFRQPVTWRRMQRRAMRQDFGWDGPTREYLALYGTLTGSGTGHLSSRPECRRDRWPEQSVPRMPMPARPRTAQAEGAAGNRP